MSPIAPSLQTEEVRRRAAEVFNDHRQDIYRRTDRLFAGLMAFQWLGAILAAFWLSPRTWSGTESQIHPHVWAALFLGGAISVFPIGLALARPGHVITRQVIALSQCLMSSLLIHISGGRIETHFHVFGSLAFLAFYRDWRVLVTATVVVATDHLVRGLYWPESVYGVAAAPIWRTLEHAGWVIFEDTFLLISCHQSIQEMKEITLRQAQLEVAEGILLCAHDDLEARVHTRTVELAESNHRLNEAYQATIEGWARALDLRDQETQGHSERVTQTTLRLAKPFHLDPEQLVHIERGALLHDIGKMGIPDRILLKPGPLDDGEWDLMRRHPTYAYEMLSPIAFLRPALDIPYCHHEKWDGTGYPRGLAGEDIPLAARLFAVVDVWDALRSDRPYRKAWKRERVLDHIQGLAGTHFDPQVVGAFLSLMAENEERRSLARAA